MCPRFLFSGHCARNVDICHFFSVFQGFFNESIILHILTGILSTIIGVLCHIRLNVLISDVDVDVRLCIMSSKDGEIFHK